MTSTAGSRVATTNRDYAVALSRAFAGALLFSLPLLLTMEMWWLGLTLEPWRIVLFALVNLLVLYGLSKVAGFEESHDWTDDILDALAAYFVAALTAAAILWLVGAIRPDMPPAAIAGMIAVQAVPASFGAMIGAKLLGEGEEIERAEGWRDTYGGQLFLFLAGALFLSFTVAPTEEVLLIAVRIAPAQALALVLLSVVLLHAILYVVQFYGQKQRFRLGHGRAFLVQTLPGYAAAILVSAYILWTFGRLDGLGAGTIAAALAVLGFPASIGAGIARVAI